MKVRCFRGQSVRECPPEELPDLLKSADNTVWVDITAATDEDVKTLQDVFHFHPLAIEDIRNQKQRPKADEFTDHVFIILNPLEYRSAELAFFRELDVFIGRNYVVTAHLEHEPVIDEALERLKPHRRSLPLSATHLLYILMDVVVDGYFPALEHIDNEIDELSNQLLERPSRDNLNTLFQVKRTMGEMWRVMWPQRDIMNILMNHNLVFIDQNSQYYLRDIADHLIKVTDLVQVYRENLNSLINLYVSAVSNQLNINVNRLTIFTIAIGTLSVIVGFYGMNFESTWPPFSADWGVLFILVLMILLIGGLFALFRRNKWY